MAVWTAGVIAIPATTIAAMMGEEIAEGQMEVDAAAADVGVAKTT